MKVKLFKEHILTSERDLHYYTNADHQPIRLVSSQWDNSLKIMKVETLLVFVNGFERFNSMIGGVLK